MGELAMHLIHDVDTAVLQPVRGQKCRFLVARVASLQPGRFA
jgi:hypothetical protein